MKINRMISAIDTHTCGAPTRNIIGGLPYIPGKTMSDKMKYFQEKYDKLRTMLMFEPRGRSNMSGAIFTEPCHPDADIGVFFIEVGGYLPMCGHSTIGCCTALVETGMISTTEPITLASLDTPAGLIKVKLEIENNYCKSVTIRNIPSFLYASNVDILIKDIGKIYVDIAYGGNFYAIVEAASVGLSILPENANQIITMGKFIREAVNKKIKVRHPEKEFINDVTHVQFYGPPTHKDAHAKNVVVILPGAISRSPCGTGTSARLATMYAKKEIKMGEEFVYESPIGTIFKAKIVEEVTVGSFKAVINEITGSAYVTGIHQFVVDNNDPLKEGFYI